MTRPALQVIEGSSTDTGGSAVTRPALRLIHGGSRARAGAATGPRRSAGAGRGRGFLATAASTAGGWLLEPTEPPPEAVASAPASPRPVIAVFGLASQCGGTVVARALAAELAGRDASGTAAVVCESRATSLPLATRAASQLARTLELVPGVAARAVGRVCLVDGPDQLALADSSRYLAPLVLDAGSAALGGASASVADRTVLVTTPEIEPALMRVATACLVRVGVEPLTVVNRVRPTDRRPSGADSAEATDDDDGMTTGAAGMLTTRAADSEDRLDAAAADLDRRFAPEADAPLLLPEARMGARLALGGREARGELGRAIAELADRCGGIE